MNTEQRPVVIGVDVGPESVRAGLFDTAGTPLACVTHPLVLFQGPAGHVEQSAAQIWDAVCHCVRAAVADSGVAPARIAGIGIAAAGALVVVGPGGAPLPVGPSEDPARNVIAGADPRAAEQARAINATGHAVIQYVGGKVSPEMATPRLLWLKENRPAVYCDAWQFFDLADYLTWRATGDLSRSSGPLTCRWTYLAHERRWDADYFQQVGLEDLADEEFCRIGSRVVEPGTACGLGLEDGVAREMGLRVGTPVGAGILDIHAGGLGTVGVGNGAAHNLAYVFGASSCTLTSTAAPTFIPGVWGPYYSAMVPGMWLNEGGQSAAGSAISRLLVGHPASPWARLQAEAAGVSLTTYLADLALARVGTGSEAVRLAEGLHVVPEYVGNRAPLADPDARAVIAGLGMETDLGSLVSLYVAGVCGIGYGLRQIMEAQSRMGVEVGCVVISGVAGRHPLVRQLVADACGCEVLATGSDEPALVGAAILGAVAGGICRSVEEVMSAFSVVEGRYSPNAGLSRCHAQRYDDYQLLQDMAQLIRQEM